MMIIGIIGGGASGMAAALEASKNPGVQVVLFERQARLGKKLLATGNGRCNLTNMNACSGGYHGQDAAFAAHALAQMPPTATLEWFAGLGLLTVTESTGRVYPYSDQANSVVDVLRFAMGKPNIRLCLGAEVTKISKTDDGFAVSTDAETVRCDNVIIACGGLAGTKLGGGMAGYKLLARFGHKSTKLRPALVQLKTGWPRIAALKGVRANCHVQILCDGALHSESTGEIQFTDYGLSGPVIFETSRDACYGSGKWTAKLDFLPQWDEEMLFRAGIFGMIRDMLGRKPAYIVSVGLFSLYHVWSFAVVDPIYWVYLLQYIPVSFLLARCYERTNSIWCPIFFHMAVNGVAVNTLDALRGLI